MIKLSAVSSQRSAKKPVFNQMHNLPSMQELSPYPKAEIGPETAAAYDIEHGEEAYVETDRGRYRMMRGRFMPFQDTWSSGPE